MSAYPTDPIRCPYCRRTVLVAGYQAQNIARIARLQDEIERLKLKVVSKRKQEVARLEERERIYRAAHKIRKPGPKSPLWRLVVNT